MKFTHVIMITMIGVIVHEPLQAQVQRTMTFDAGTSLLLQEFNAMLLQNETGLQVEMIMGRSEGASDTMTDQLERGDLILMMNGKRVSEVAAMRELYSSLTDGEVIKIGVRRGDARFIVNAQKGDIPEGAGGQMVLSFDMGDGAAPIMVPELGLLLTTNDQGIEIMSVLEPLLPDELQNKSLESFFISTVNERTFDQAENLRQYLASLKVGDAIFLQIQKDGEIQKIELTKQEPRGNVRMSIDN